MSLRIKNAFILLLSFLVLLTVNAEEKKKFAAGFNKTPEKIYKSVKEIKYSSSTSSELPQKVDLTKFLPNPGNQGQQGSCVAWSSAYAYKSFHEKVERDWSLDNEEHLFSPAYVYNQLNGGNDNGLYIGDALNLIVKQGVCPLSAMPYDENDYLTQPDSKAKKEASKYKALSYAKVDFKNTDEVKKILSKNNCVVFGMNIYESIYEYKGGICKSVSGSYLGGHAMLLIGYDDNKNAYKIINSWSKNWGDQGYAWFDYDFFAKYTTDAWVMYDDFQGDPGTPPDAPVDVAASEGSYSDRIRVSWTPSKNATSYTVYRSDSEDGEYEEIGRTDESSFFDSKVESGNNYFYSVVALSNSGESDYSSIATGYTKTEKVITGIPQNVQGDSKESMVFLRWDKVEGAAGYYIYRYSKKKDDYIKIAESKIAKFKDKKVKVNSKYWYIITSFNENGESDKSETVQVNVEEEAEKEEAPGIPVNLNVSKGEFEDSIKISWDKTPNTQNYYLIKWYSPLKEWEVIGNVKETSYIDKDVKSGVSYYYTVAAINNYGYSEYAEYVIGYVNKSISKASSPGGLTATQGKFKNKIVVKWDKVNNANGYYVTKSYTKKGDKNFKGKKVDIGPFTELTFIDYDVADGYIYTYEINSFNQFGLSEKGQMSANGWTEGTDNNKSDNSYYKYSFDKFDTIRDGWDYKKFDDKFFKYIESQFKELDKEINELEKEMKK